jgi:hypothetical protein
MSEAHKTDKELDSHVKILYRGLQVIQTLNEFCRWLHLFQQRELYHICTSISVNGNAIEFYKALREKVIVFFIVIH